MKIAFTIFAIISGILFFVVLICWIEDGEGFSYYTKIKFKTFKCFYEINPERWNLYFGTVSCHLGNKIYTQLKFGFVDYLRYLLWRTARDRYNTKKDQIESMSKVIAVVKEDIKNLEIFAEQQVNEGVDMINDILQEKKK